MNAPRGTIWVESMRCAKVTTSDLHDGHSRSDDVTPKYVKIVNRSADMKIILHVHASNFEFIKVTAVKESHQCRNK
jgi:hypothetical protein